MDYDELQRQWDTSSEDLELAEALLREARRHNDTTVMQQVAHIAHGCGHKTCFWGTLLELSEPDESDGFVRTIARLLEGVMAEHVFSTRLSLVKIDNWFSAKWQGFTGTAVSQGLFAPTTQPPFRENRVRARARLHLLEGGGLRRLPELKRGRARKKRRSTAMPLDEAFAWYSGNTEKNGRGCIMLYVPIEEPDYLSNTHWMGYITLKRENSEWTLGQTASVTRDQIQRWMTGSLTS